MGCFIYRDKPQTFCPTYMYTCINILCVDSESLRTYMMPPSRRRQQLNPKPVSSCTRGGQQFARAWGVLSLCSRRFALHARKNIAPLRASRWAERVLSLWSFIEFFSCRELCTQYSRIVFPQAHRSGTGRFLPKKRQ